MESQRSLPRTIFVVRSGVENAWIQDAAAASAVAAFVSEEHVPAGAPIAVILDQSVLPDREEYICTRDWRVVVDAIATLKVRGAPAIGIAGSIALMLFAFSDLPTAQLAGDAPCKGDAEEGSAPEGFDAAAYEAALTSCAQTIAHTRPTAVSLSRAVDASLEYARTCLCAHMDACSIAEALFEVACARIKEDERINRAIGEAGAPLLKEHPCVLTHCNAGSLATGYFGTALGVVYAAASHGWIERVYADETRPVCQGSRLTVWELSRAHIPTTLICDDMAAYVMSKGLVQACIVGADRIAANGDVANKIGTLSVAINAHHFNIPFYVAAPLETIDFALASGDGIPIEMRGEDEVCKEPPCGVDILNPAFDVTPAELVTAIITEEGVYAPHELAGIAPLSAASSMKRMR